MSNTPKTLTSEECELLLDRLLYPHGHKQSAPKSLRNFCMALLMLDAGLRVGEVVKLPRSALIFNGASVTTLILTANVAKLHIERSVPVSDRLRKAIETLIGRYWFTSKLCPEPYAFFSVYPDKPLTARQIERIIGNAGKQVLGHHVFPHRLRHTFASRLMRTCSIRVVQELLGHKSVTSTQIYTHPNGDDLRKAIGTLPKGGRI